MWGPRDKYMGTPDEYMGSPDIARWGPQLRKYILHVPWEPPYYDLYFINAKWTFVSISKESRFMVRPSPRKNVTFTGKCIFYLCFYLHYSLVAEWNRPSLRGMKCASDSGMWIRNLVYLWSNILISVVWFILSVGTGYFESKRSFLLIARPGFELWHLRISFSSFIVIIHLLRHVYTLHPFKSQCERLWEKEPRKATQ